MLVKDLGYIDSHVGTTRKCSRDSYMKSRVLID
jgi:hypothetical protein